MPTYVALLRAVNLGSHNKVAMPKLRAAVEALGYRDVSTYIQSGNLILTADDKAAAVEQTVRDAIADAFGLDVVALVRSRDQLKKIVDANPFVDKARELNHLHAVFLATKPEAKAVDSLTSADWGGDEVHVRGTEAYLHLPNGYGRAKLNNMVVEKSLGVPATARNWRTTTKLLELCG